MQKIFKLPKGLICLLLFSIFITVGCDDNNNNSFPVTTGAPPGLDCLDASSNSSIIEDNIDCPAEAVVNICTGFVCDIDSTGQGGPVTRRSALFFAPSNCEASSCLDFSCDSQTSDSSSGMLIDKPSFGEYTIDTVFGNVITGTVFLTDEETSETKKLSFSCSPLVI